MGEFAPTTSFWRVTSAQVCLLAASRRWLALLVSMILAVLLARAPFSRLEIGDPALDMPWVVKAYGLIVTLAFAWPTVVWWGEPPTRRFHHHAMPTPRGVHDLARVSAGGIWLLIGVATAFSAASVSLFITEPALLHSEWVAQWWCVATGATVAYALASNLAVRLSWPLLTLAAFAVAVRLVDIVLDVLGWQAAERVWAAPFVGPLSITDALSGAFFAAYAGRMGDAWPRQAPTWPWAALLWLVLLVAGLVLPALTQSER